MKEEDKLVIGSIIVFILIILSYLYCDWIIPVK